MKHLNVKIPQPELASFCRQHHIRRLAFFGSILRADFRPDSDIDVLVEFEPEHVPGFVQLARMRRELSRMFNGRKVDLCTPQALSKFFRDEVCASAEVQYEQR
jgi:predicted nucleotidyltransferase